LISAEQGISAVKPVLSEVLKGLEEDKPKKPLLELTSS